MRLRRAATAGSSSHPGTAGDPLCRLVASGASLNVTAPKDTLPSSWRDNTRSIWRKSRAQVRGHDIIVLTAAMSFSGALAVVRLLLIALRLAAVAVSPARLLQLSARLSDALPTGLGAQSVVDLLVHAGLSVSALGVVLAVVPVTVYGEGLRRVLLRLQGQGAEGRED